MQTTSMRDDAKLFSRFDRCVHAYTETIKSTGGWLDEPETRCTRKANHGKSGSISKLIDKSDCETCKKFESTLPDFPVKVEDVLVEPLFGDSPLADYIGSFVAVWPFAEEYEGHAYLGVIVGDFPSHISVVYDNSNQSFVAKGGDPIPLIVVPSLQRTFWTDDCRWQFIGDTDTLFNRADFSLGGFKRVVELLNSEKEPTVVANPPTTPKSVFTVVRKDVFNDVVNSLVTGSCVLQSLTPIQNPLTSQRSSSYEANSSEPPMNGSSAIDDLVSDVLSSSSLLGEDRVVAPVEKYRKLASQYQCVYSALAKHVRAYEDFAATLPKVSELSGVFKTDDDKFQLMFDSIMH